MNKILICPFCGEVVKRSMNECSRCGATREIMEREIDKRKNQELTQKQEQKEQEFNEETKQLVKENPKDFSQDASGKIEIKTDDVTILPGSYSIKTARGDNKQEKPKWWEIYKKADLILARRKIVREVNKEGRRYPEGKKKWKLLLLTVLFGFMGVHNFYATNKKKGWIHFSFFVFVCIFANLKWEFLAVSGLDWLLGGFAGFMCIFWWFLDLFNILFNKFVFDKTKNEFISKLNYNTRSKLGKKYINDKK